MEENELSRKLWNNYKTSLIPNISEDEFKEQMPRVIRHLKNLHKYDIEVTREWYREKAKDTEIFSDLLNFLDRVDSKLLAKQVRKIVREKYRRFLIVDLLIGAPLGAFLALKALDLLSLIKIPQQISIFQSIWFLAIACFGLAVQLIRILNDVYQIVQTRK